MRKIKILTIGLIITLITAATSLNGVYAGNNKGSECKKNPPMVPEPVNYALLLVGGVTLAALRRWRSKRVLKDSGKHDK